MIRSEAFNPLRSLESAWKIAMKAPLPMWVGGLILIAIESFGGGFSAIFDVGDGRHRDQMAFLAAIGSVSCCFSLLAVVAGSWLTIGFSRGVRTVMRDGDVPFESLFRSEGLLPRMLLTRLAQWFFSVLALLPFGIPWAIGLMLQEGLRADEELAIAVTVIGVLVYLPVYVYIALGMALMPWATALEGLSPLAAFSRSWELAGGVRWMLLLFSLAEGLLTLVGLLLCCVGVLPAGALAKIMWVEAYVRATDIVGDREEWWIESQDRGPGRRDYRRDPSSYHRERPMRDVEVDEPAAAPPSAAPEPPSSGPFDPGAWRHDADIPPIDDEPRG
ncbi:MAG: hypothetical protein H6828_03685 [Planctomycetes bacterium]|nr:hypothetical protein [Planctomycetota bacterium]